MLINFNGKTFPSEQAIFNGQNRAFLYGDALFETIRMFEGKIPFLRNHVNRLLHGLHFLKYKVPKKYTSSFFKKEIKKISDGNARIRISVFRSSGGLYTPTNNRPQFLIEATPLSSPSFSLNKKGLKIGIFDEIKLPCSTISNFKTCNSSPYILAGLNKQERNLDDVILLNEKGRIAEASSSNIFFIKKNKIITPSLSEGCVAGTMRKTILKIASEKNYSIKESTIKLPHLKNIEEIWLTNAISGIRWVSQIDPYISLQNTSHAPDFINSLNQI